MTTTFIGQPVSCVDGRQNVTGAAPYAAEFDVPNVAHGAIERSAIPSGASRRSTAEPPPR
jgi:xanthine dehydrogenase YagR molybdenum-binding subunit